MRRTSGAASIVRPYNGYWHLYPRTVALIGTKVPVRHLPSVVRQRGDSGHGVRLLALVSARLSERAIARAGMVAAVLLVPFSDELWLTLTNMQWFGALLLVALLAAPAPATARAAVAWSVGGIVIGLSGPFALLLSPCAAWRAWWHRDRWSLWVLLLFSACAAATMLALIGHPRGGGLTTLPQRLVPLMHAALSHKLALLAAIARQPGAARRPGARGDAPPMGAHGLQRGWTARHGRYGRDRAHRAADDTLRVHSMGRWRMDRDHACRARLSTRVARAGRGPGHLGGQPQAGPLQPYPWARDAECLEREQVCAVTVNPSWRVGLPGRGGRSR